MSKNYYEEDIPDNDPTDELPILTEVLLAPDPDNTASMPAARDDDDTGSFAAPAIAASLASAAHDEHTATLQRDLADRDSKLGTLEQELAGLEARWRATCAELAARDAELAGLRVSLEAHDARQALSAEAAETAREEIRARDARIAQLTEELAAAQAAAAALEDSSRTLEKQIAELESDQAAKRELPQSAEDAATIAQLREEIAGLAAHIENRNQIWRDQAATVMEKSARIRELELELAQRVDRQQAAELHARTESEQAEEFRRRLNVMTAALEQAQRRPRDAAPDMTDYRGAAADGPAQLRQELERAVALQLSAGDDPEQLRRLEELEAAIRDLEHDMDATSAQPPPEPVRPREPSRLICLTGEDIGPYVLDDSVLTIGRGNHCDVRIMTHYVSREHARISFSKGQCVIEDVGSRNGIFVNSVRIERQRLDDNDLVTIGDTQFRYQAGNSGTE
jgi:hypothetical protein